MSSLGSYEGRTRGVLFIVTILAFEPELFRVIWGYLSKDYLELCFKKIEKQLCGKKIVFVRYMTPEEAESSGWYYQPLLIFFDDGSAICAMSDDEANNAGSIGVFKGSCKTDPVLDTIPVMRY